MRVVEAGRLVFPHDATAARAFAKRNLVSLHSRYDRLSAIAGHVDLEGESREVRDLSPLPFIADDREAAAIAELLPKESTDDGEWLLLRDYEDQSRSRSILFAFRAGKLASVVKVRRLEEGGLALRNEAAVLNHLQSSASEVVSTKIPKVFELGSTRHHEVLVLSPVAGQPLWISMQRSFLPLRSHQEQLSEVGTWLGRFHRDLSHSDGGIAPAVARPEYLALEGSPAAQQVVVHGDLWARNILFHADQLSGIVDWERASLRGYRWHDLFALPLLFVLQRPAWRKNRLLDRFEDGFIRDSPAAAVVRRYLDGYVRESGIENGLLRPMFEAFLAGADAESGKEERGWRQSMPWPAMRARLKTASRTVFSG